MKVQLQYLASKGCADRIYTSMPYEVLETVRIKQTVGADKVTTKKGLKSVIHTDDNGLFELELTRKNCEFIKSLGEDFALVDEDQMVFVEQMLSAKEESVEVEEDEGKKKGRGGKSRNSRTSGVTSI